MKFGVLGLLVLLLSPVYGEECNKEEAKKAVDWACTRITEKGKAGLDDIQKHRFCGDNYVWIQDSPDIRMVLHPVKTNLNHKAYGGSNRNNLKAFKDREGKAIFIEFDKMAIAQVDGAWVDYVWPKPGDESGAPTPKVSFVKKCAGGLNWVAGSGVWK